MKKIVNYETAIGTDGGKLAGELGIEAEMLTVQVKASYPLAKVLDPAFAVMDQLVDKLEAIIPGDQKAMATAAKADARAALVKALSEQAQA